MSTAKKLTKTLVFLSFLVAIPVVLYLYVFGVVIKPHEIGVRKNAFSFWGLTTEGYSSIGLEPGWHWQIPSLSDVTVIPRTFQFIQLNDTQGSLAVTADYPDRAGSLVVPTADGNKVKTDITIIARLADSPTRVTNNNVEQYLEYVDSQAGLPPFAKQFPVSTGGPRDFSNQAAPFDLFVQRAKGQLRENLSSLTSTQFYDPALRERAVLISNAGTRKFASEYGVVAWATLLRRYLYVDQAIDDQIFAKNLQEQTEQLNSAKRELAAAEAKTEEARALWDAKIRNLGIEGDTQAQILKSEGALYKEKQVAAGDLLIKTAEAEIDKKKSGLYAKVEGADVFLAREMAPLLTTLNGGIVSGLDPYDLQKWVEKLTGKTGKNNE